MGKVDISPKKIHKYAVSMWRWWSSLMVIGEMQSFGTVGWLFVAGRI